MSTVSLKFEVEFVAGSNTWVDVTADVDMSQQITITYGRTSPYSSAQVATLNGVELNNPTGKYTPKSQFLADGVTAHPYYPNILPRRRIRVSYIVSATVYYVFWGYIQSWSPMMENGARPYVPITAVDRGSLLAGISVPYGAAVQSMLTDSPIALFPFHEDAGASSWNDISGNGYVLTVKSVTNNSLFVSGASDPIPWSDGSTGLQVTGATSTLGAFVNATFQSSRPIVFPSSMATSWSISAWMTATRDPDTGFYPLMQIVMADTVNSTEAILTVQPAASVGVPLAETCVASMNYGDPTGFLLSSNYNVVGALPHHYMVTGSDNGTTLTVMFYIDGALVETKTMGGGGGTFASIGTGYVLGSVASETSAANPPGVFGPVGAFPVTLSAARVAQHYYGGVGGLGQTTGQRITEYLYWAGVPTGDQTVATGLQKVANHAVAGKDILTLCGDMATTEGSGAVFWHTPAGKSTFVDRHYRSTVTPLVTLDAVNDLDGTRYAPSFDDLTLVNEATLSRPNGTPMTYINAASVTAYGAATDPDSADVYCDTDLAVLNLAQDRVSSQAVPGFRVGQLAVTFITALTSGLYPLFGVMQIGSRARVASLVAGKSAPTATVDVFVEGWTAVLSIDTFDVTFDTSPADNPPRAKWGTFRWAPVPGAMTLNAAITASATTLAIARTDAYFMTTTAGSYPLTIRVGEEDITLNSAPGGTSSPQSFTGVTRGANGTRAAPQAAGAVVALSPRYAWQL